MNAIIVGGGIGGLTAAIALNRAGIKAEVYERASELGEVGAGISLWANAISALDALGIGDAIRRRGLPEGDGGLRTSNGSLLSPASYEGLIRKYGVALVVLHRADLLALLKDQVRMEQLHLGHECLGFEQDATGVRVKFANGKIAEGDILIGADGLRSVVRAQLFGTEPPIYTGYTAWRSVAHFTMKKALSGETWGPGKRFGIVPLGDGRVYWYATHSEPAGGDDASAGGAKKRLLELFRGWHEPIEALISASSDDSMLRNDIYDRDPLSHWSVGRATLLGDAAHPMSPNLGQGACQAIEDGVELAACLRNSAGITEGLTAYEHRRIARTSKVVLQARRIGQLGQWHNPVATSLRNLLLRATPPGIAEKQLDWIVGYDPLSPAERVLLSKG